MQRQLAIAAAMLLASSAGWAQTPLTNADLIKLSKAGMSEEFILNSIDQQGSQFSTGVMGLIEMKNSGVSERVLREALRKSPPRESLRADSVLQLARAGFSDDFLGDLIRQQREPVSADPEMLEAMKRAGVGERVLSLLTHERGVRDLPSGAQLHVRLIDPIDSEKNREGDRFRASLEEDVMLGNDVAIPRGADARVRLIADTSSGKLTGRTELTLRLDEISVEGKPVTINSSAVSEYSHSQGASTAKKAVAVGAVGAIIGALAGGGKGAAIGAAAGAGAGAGSGVFMKGQRVKVPTETVLTFTTEGSIRLP